MKYLTEREQIATAMNFGKYPVLYIDLDDRKFDGSDYAKGFPVKVAWDRPAYPGMTTRGELYIENGRYGIGNDAACLHKDFGRSDIIEDARWAMVQTIHTGQAVILIEDHTKTKECGVRVMKVADKLDVHCSTCTYLVDVEEDFEV